MQRKENHRCMYIGGSVAGMTGFEPAVSTLTGSHVRPTTPHPHVDFYGMFW